MNLSAYEARYTLAWRHLDALTKYLQEADTKETRLAGLLIEDFVDAASDYISELKHTTLGTMTRSARILQEARFNLLHASIVATSEEEEQVREEMVSILTERINELEQQAIEELERERETND